MSVMGKCWVPGGIDAEEGHGLEAGLLRKFLDKFQQITSVFKLAQVDTVSHSLPVRHYSHLENTQTNTHIVYCQFHPISNSWVSLSLILSSPLSPPRLSAEDVVGSGGIYMTQVALYSRQRTSAAMEDVTYNHLAAESEEFPVFPSGKLR